MLIEKPWARVKNPTPIPAGDLRAALTALDDLTFAELIRSHLVPRDTEADGRVRWQQMWTEIDHDAALADRAFDVLEQFLDAAEAAIDNPDLDAAQLQRAQKFHRFCDDSWQRLQGSLKSDEPLGWAGRAGAGFNKPARKVIEQLVEAISDHRNAGRDASAPPTAADRRLWEVLRRVDLDPERIRR